MTFKAQPVLAKLVKTEGATFENVEVFFWAPIRSERLERDAERKEIGKELKEISRILEVNENKIQNLDDVVEQLPENTLGNYIRGEVSQIGAAQIEAQRLLLLLVEKLEEKK